MTHIAIATDRPVEPSDLESTVRFLVDELTVLRLDANTMAKEITELRQEVTWLRSGTSKVTTQLQAAFVALGKEVQSMRRYRDGGVPKPSASKN